MLSNKVKCDSLVCSGLVILTFLTRQREEIKRITNQKRQFEIGKCQGPRGEVHMQSASQLLIVLINKCRGREEKVTMQGGRQSISQPRKGTRVLSCSKGQAVLPLPSPHLCKTQ